MHNPAKVQQPRLSNPLKGGGNRPYVAHRRKLRKSIWG